MLPAPIVFVLGLVFLILGADLLVRGSARLAVALGVSPLVTGLTVVAIGTSSPELVVSLKALALDSPSVAVGNIVGSNICNTLVVLGFAALLAPLAISRRVIRRDVPIMIVVSFLPLVLGFDGTIGRLGGLLLLSLLIFHTIWIVRSSGREPAEGGELEGQDGEPYSDAIRPRWMWNIALVIAGLVLLFVGARWVVQAAVGFARYLGVTELLIGLTVVAVSTSLPEIATSVVAAFRGRTDIAVGNVVGSNILNILAILGLASAASSTGLYLEPDAIQVDLPVMIAASVACLPICFSGRSIDRLEGGLFLLCYCAYLVYHVLRGLGHSLLPVYSVATLGILIPLALIIVAISFLRSAKSPF